MKLSKFMAGLVLVAGSGSVFAADECATWGCVSSISTLYVNAEGSIFVGTPLDETLANCAPVSGVYFTLKPSAGNAKEIYSTLLAAYMSDKKIQLRIVEGSNQCELDYVRLESGF